MPTHNNKKKAERPSAETTVYKFGSNTNIMKKKNKQLTK